MIYGTALLAACMLCGSYIGNVLGALLGLKSDVGGVGFAMLLLLLVTNSKKLSEKLPNGTFEGLNFWSGMFLPIIIALSAGQNVYSAMSSGAVAIIAGLAATALAFVLVPVLGLMSKKNTVDNVREEE